MKKTPMSIKRVPHPPARPPERGVWGAQPPGKRKKRVYILIYISIYIYPSGALVESQWSPGNTQDSRKGGIGKAEGTKMASVADEGGQRPGCAWLGGHGEGVGRGKLSAPLGSH